MSGTTIHAKLCTVSIATCLLVASANIASYAQDAPTTTQTTPATTQAAPLQAGVQKVVLSLQKLQDIGLDLKHVMSAAGHVYDEVTIQPVTLITEPEVVGRGIIINIPIGTMPTGPVQPPDKDRLELSMNEITPVVSLMKKNCDDFTAGRKQLDLSDDVRTELKPMFEQWVQLVNNIAADLNNLQQLTQGPNYDNAAIASAAKALQQDIKTLDTTRRSIYKIIRKEGNSDKSDK